jgi:EAL domain-containing protein (putative c-di-GMP-specific phosphodiesterase class I)
MGIRNSLIDHHKPLSRRWRVSAIDTVVENGSGTSIERAALANRVRKGLEVGEFELAFQGIHHCGSGELKSVEALIRWIHPEYGLLPPSAFLSTMSDPVVALELTYFVIARACRYLGERQRMGRAVCPVAINVPPSIAARPEFAADIERIALAHGANLSQLEIELSETEDATALLSSPALMRAIRNTGVRIAMDDFGTGYSSLATLSLIDIDTVKVARELMLAVPSNPRACAVTAGALDMLCDLGVRVVVEGIETAAQARWLSRWPDVLVQGYLWGKPRLGLASVAGTEHHLLRAAGGWV